MNSSEYLEAVNLIRAFLFCLKDINCNHHLIISCAFQKSETAITIQKRWMLQWKEVSKLFLL